jgi:hypothetical protein
MRAAIDRRARADQKPPDSGGFYALDHPNADAHAYRDSLADPDSHAWPNADADAYHAADRYACADANSAAANCHAQPGADEL